MSNKQMVGQVHVEFVEIVFSFLGQIIFKKGSVSRNLWLIVNTGPFLNLLCIEQILIECILQAKDVLSARFKR